MFQGRWAINADASRKFRFSNTTQMDARLVGSIGWDSGSCQVSGTLGVQYEERGLKGKACGCVEVPGPIPLASGFELRIRFTFRENSRQ